MGRVNLGDEVLDTVSGFRGIAISKHLYLHGCTRISVQPPVKRGEKKLEEYQSFDEPQLKVVKEKKVKVGAADTGGPARYMPKNRSRG